MKSQGVVCLSHHIHTTSIHHNFQNQKKDRKIKFCFWWTDNKVENDDDESLKTSNDRQYEGDILAAMCDYSNVCPTLVALLQPQTMDDNNDYCPLPTMMKSFEEEKKSFDEIEDQIIKIDDDDNLLEPAESFDSLIDKPQNPVPSSSPPMKIFNKFSPTFMTTDDNSEDKDIEIGLDDLGPRWKASLSAAVGAPPLTNNEDSDDE